jgi:hypothetical protein
MRRSPVDPRTTTGIHHVQDVYAGPGLQGVPRATAKEIRVVKLDFRAAGIGFNENSGPAGRVMVGTPIAISNGADPAAPAPSATGLDRQKTATILPPAS